MDCGKSVFINPPTIADYQSNSKHEEVFLYPVCFGDVLRSIRTAAVQPS
ncbi:MAG: hypothetical protein ACI959_001086 [Limisphaerales bacterium]|jgi:hypothetical protein